MSKKVYEVFERPTKEVLDTIKVDDMIKCNDWKESYKVKSVSENYFIATRPFFSDVLYTICHKDSAGFERWHGDGYGIEKDLPYIGPDNYVFGNYDYKDDCDDAIKELESGEMEVSERRGVALYRIQIKRM